MRHSPLEDVPDRKKDWHPGSEKQVLDLVHPSLFPLVCGQTRSLGDKTLGIDDCMKRCGDGEVLLVAPQEGLMQGGFHNGYRRSPEENNAWSQKHQWLPNEFDISQRGNDVK